MRIRPRRSAARTVILLFCLLLCAAITPTAPATPAASAASVTPAASASARSDRYAAIDAYVRDRMEATRTPGISYAVVGPDGPIHQRSWGTDGQGERVTARTPFLWGSVAKPITSTAVMTLVQDGRLRLGDRIVDHLPSFRFGGAEHASRVTVRHLLNQTAGIPESATFKVADCFDADCPRPAERVGDLDDVQPLGPPGTKYAYTSANYLVLSAVVEAVTKRPFADYLKRSVLDPAGMDGAIVDQASARRRSLPPGHQLLWGKPAAIADGVDNHGASYGYTGGDLSDLAAFASFQLRSGRTAGGDAVLTPESAQMMREEGKLRPTGAGTGYGMGWRVGGLDAPLDDAIWHTGATPGYSAMLFLLPKQNIAIVVQQNLHGLLHDDAVMQVGFGAARMLAGGSAPSGASASSYYMTVWGTTALALALILAAGRSALLLRRPATHSSPLRRTVLTSLWCLAGALPWIASALLVSRISLGEMMNWVPDTFIAVCVAATAGAATIVLRLILVIRALRAPRARPDTGRGSPFGTSATARHT
ncbi:serine hydrolase domain-containing protein [Streptomyces sp. NBC_01187]|uniref:serine hydrolase domain-containing protein n=1 Tax=Streptomyces sp. NBC_01187 TaxID=2903766 RepID=UPI0038647E3B|nr:beta-lactamase family protein [Streptomyces sp. NBC_01187]